MHSEAAMRRLELMATALEEVVRLHREVMDELKNRPGESDDGERERPGPVGGECPDTP